MTYVVKRGDSYFSLGVAPGYGLGWSWDTEQRNALRFCKANARRVTQLFVGRVVRLKPPRSSS